MAGGGGKDKSALDIMEESVYLLKGQPIRLVPYYIGCLPFVLGLLYFWTDMSTGPAAWHHLPQAAWGLCLLYLWMKFWQSVYARGLLAEIRDQTMGSWGLRHVLRALCFQTAIQPWSVVLLPVAFVILFPFPRVLAFFQNVTLLGSGDEPELKRVLRESWSQAALWPVQNAVLIWLGSPFLIVFVALLVFAVVPAALAFNPGASGPVLLLIGGFVMIPLSPLSVIVGLNLGVALFLLPRLLQTLFGIETLLSLSGAWATSDVFMVVLCSLVYLCLDPLIKACYCLRCFYGTSLRTGEDLLVELKRLRNSGLVTLLLLIILLGLSSPVRAAAAAPTSAALRQDPPISASKLDAALDRTVNLPQYAWRMPRETSVESMAGPGVLHRFLGPIVKALGAYGVSS